MNKPENFDSLIYNLKQFEFSRQKMTNEVSCKNYSDPGSFSVKGRFSVCGSFFGQGIDFYFLVFGSFFGLWVVFR